MSIKGPITPRLEPVGDLHRAGGLGEALGEGVVNAVLHQNPVGADAGLAGIAVFRSDRTLDRHLDIAVVKEDERHVAPVRRPCYDHTPPECRGALNFTRRSER
jgi:hypothetical protein